MNTSSSPRHERYDDIVIGGGFFGCILAAELARKGHSVLLLEKEADLLLRASYGNQARVHNGYHYPRSVLTALRSRVNFPRFTSDFGDCVVSDFEKLYAVPHRFSKVNARQFRLFMERMGSPIKPAAPPLQRLFDSEWIEGVFSVVEYAFDATRLRATAARLMEEAGVEFHTGATALEVAAAGTGLKLNAAFTGGAFSLHSGTVYNCTYSQINGLLERSGLPGIPLKHELAEMALIEPPEEIRKVGVTVMCGPFFSVMPFPARSLHSLSHVRYTPHCSWQDGVGTYIDGHEWLARAEKITAYPRMLRDSARYMPCLSKSEYRDSIWEIKTVLPQSEMDDSRPILYRKDHGLPGLTCIMGGKIDNIYDVLAELGLDFIPTR